MKNKNELLSQNGTQSVNWEIVSSCQVFEQVFKTWGCPVARNLPGQPVLKPGNDFQNADTKKISNNNISVLGHLIAILTSKLRKKNQSTIAPSVENANC